MNDEYDEHDTYGGHGEENEDLEKDITGHAHDAENALLNMIEDYQVEKLQDPDVWEVVEGFMSRVVKLLSYLEDVHEENRPQHGHEDDSHGHEDDSSRLDELRDQMAENDENAEHHQQEDPTGHHHYDEHDPGHQQGEGGDGHWDDNGEGHDYGHNYNGHECYGDENRY